MLKQKIYMTYFETIFNAFVNTGAQWLSWQISELVNQTFITHFFHMLAPCDATVALMSVTRCQVGNK